MPDLAESTPAPVESVITASRLDSKARTVLCLHFVDNPNNLEDEVFHGLRPVQEGSCAYCSAIGSMELDLISYKFQNERLVHTNLLYGETVGPDGGTIYTCRVAVDVWFPAEIEFLSEGREETLLHGTPEEPQPPWSAGSADRFVRCPCWLHLNRSYFKGSGIAVWNVVLTGRGTLLGEHDLIKLMHLYEGESEQAHLESRIWFDVGCTGRVVQVESVLDTLWETFVAEKFKDKRKETFMARPFAALASEPKTDVQKELAKELRRRKAHFPKGATLQVVLGDTLGEVTLTEALRVVYGARRENQVVTPRRALRRRNQKSFSDELEGWLEKPTDTGRKLVALAGIVNGIFDFAEIGDEEIMDTLDPTFSSGDNFIKVHRRNLINLTDSDRVLGEVGEEVGISPYFIIPHSVIFHNEEIIDRVDDCLVKFMDPPPETDGPAERGRAGSAPSLKMLENLKAIALRETKRRYVPNLFNYATEKAIYENAFAVRGSEVKRRYTLDRMVDLERQIDAAHEDRRRRDDAVVQLLLLLLTVAQVFVIFVDEANIPQFPLLQTLMVAGLLFLLGWFYLFRRVL